MQPTYVQRLRLTFSKIGATRYIGHLDLARTWERILNRAKLPVTYTQGFNRRPRMQMATALPLGFTSDCEMIEILMDERMTLADVGTQLNSKMAPGIVLHRVEEIEIKAPLLQNSTVACIYSVTLLDEMDETVLQQRIDGLLGAESLMRERARGKKRKTYDLRPLIHTITLTSNPTSLTMKLSQIPNQASGRPDEVLHALEIDPADARVHRTAIILEGEPEH